MKVQLKHTREKYWDWYNVYILPTVRVSKYGNTYTVSILWLSLNLCIEYEGNNIT